MEYVVLLKEISIKVEKIEVIKDWLEFKLVCNIQVFLGFINFYWQFIQSFNKIVAPLTSIFKKIWSSDKLALNRNDNSKPASSKNDSSRLAFGNNDGNSKVKFANNNMEYTKKLGKSKS